MNSDKNKMPEISKKQNRLSPFLSSHWIPSLWNWDEMEEKMNRWFGKDTGLTVSEDNQNIYVEAHTPGMKPEDLEISLDHNTLRIRGESQEKTENKNKKFYQQAQHSFFYQVNLPAQIQEDSEQTQYQDGVLKLTFKKARQENVKQIKIKSNQEQQKNNRRK